MMLIRAIRVRSTGSRGASRFLALRRLQRLGFLRFASAAFLLFLRLAFLHFFGSAGAVSLSTSAVPSQLLPAKRISVWSAAAAGFVFGFLVLRIGAGGPVSVIVENRERRQHRGK